MKKAIFLQRHFLSDIEAHARLVQRGHLRTAAVLARLIPIADALVAGLMRLGVFLSPAAFAQRGRDRERRKLVCELDGLDAAALYDRQRRPMLTQRLQIITREDMAATLRPLRYHSARVLRAMDQRPGELTTLSDSALERLRKDLQAAEVPLGVKVDRLRACIPPKETS